jgi:LL-diaminopimelate aminotransferase
MTLVVRKSGAANSIAADEVTMSSSQSAVNPVLAPSDRLLNVPPYALAKVFQDRDDKMRQGVDVIDLGVGNPDLRPPQRAIDALKAAVDDMEVQNHRYPSFGGLPEFHDGIVAWYRNRFGVSLQPMRDTLPLIGSKEGIAKFFLGHMNPGDTLLMCTPCYPAYLGVAALAQLDLVEVPLLEANEWRPDLSAIPADVAKRAKVICVNFPGNPTGGVETREFYEELLQYARDNDLFIVSDIAYCDLSLDPTYRAMSFLEIDRERERTIEFHSFSKSYSMQGWRIGFAAGNSQVMAQLLKIKSNMDFSVFMSIQRAALAVLSGPQDYVHDASVIYRTRRDAFLDGLHRLGYPIQPPRAALYVWMRIPERFKSSLDFTADLLDKTGVLVAPGVGFGKAGEGYVRVALCVTESRLREATARMAEAGFTY